MRRAIRFSTLVAWACAALLLQACSPSVTVHGYIPEAEDLELIEPGVDTVLTVEERIGRPSSTGVLRDSDWFYVQTTISRLTYNPPEVTDRRVVAISFDEEGVVDDVAEYGLEDGRIVALNPRTTETAGARVGLLQQIFGNLLNIDAADFFN